MGRWMTIDQKRKLIQKKEAAPNMTQNELVTWVAREFKLSRPPARTTIANIMRMSATIKNQSYGDEKHRKPLKVTSPALEKRLGEWVGYVEAKKVNLNRRILTLKAQKIQSDVGGDALGLVLSVGWLTSFMHRHGLRFRVKHGEVGSVDPDVVREGRREILDLIDLFEPTNLFNMDEGSLYISQAPAGDICTKNKGGLKADKTRVTLGFCANADGSELLPLLFIGHAARPRCFNGKTGSALGYDYKYNKRAWMTSVFFQQWLRVLDKKMRAEERHILLLLDNASAHTTGDMVLTNVTVKMLPPNTTSCLQPMDAGVIASFKSRYRTRQIEQALDRIESGEDVQGAKVYKIDQLTAMRWSTDIWSDTSSTTLAHCWQRTGLALPVRNDGADQERISGEDDADVVELVSFIELWSLK